MKVENPVKILIRNAITICNFQLQTDCSTNILMCRNWDTLETRIIDLISDVHVHTQAEYLFDERRSFQK